MALQEVAFGLLALVSVVAAFLVVMAKNPVHSVLFLITVFFSAAGMFVLMGAEFLAMLLVVVYVGAVAVLFLFVVMMLDVDFVALRQGFARYAPVPESWIGLQNWPPLAAHLWALLWMLMKTVFWFFMIAMVKAIVPRYRYDQLMRLGWKVFLPTSLAAVVLVAAWRVFGPQA